MRKPFRRSAPSTRCDEERARLDSAIEANEITDCRVCEQAVKRYKRPLNSGMARALVLLVAEQTVRPDEWIHLPTVLLRNASRSKSWAGDAAKLQHWGLIVPLKGEREDGQVFHELRSVLPAGPAHVLDHLAEMEPEVPVLDDGDRLRIEGGVLDREIERLKKEKP